MNGEYQARVQLKAELELKDSILTWNKEIQVYRQRCYLQPCYALRDLWLSRKRVIHSRSVRM